MIPSLSACVTSTPSLSTNSRHLGRKERKGASGKGGEEDGDG